MKKLEKFRSQDSATHEEQPVKEPRLLKLNKEVFHAIRHRDTFAVTKARFLPDGDTHCVVISFDEEVRTLMTLKIDGETVFMINTARQPIGNTELDIDGLIVDFVWDNRRIPKFSFFTREFSFHPEVARSSSNDGRNDDEPSSSAKHWDANEHIHLLQIVGS